MYCINTQDYGEQLIPTTPKGEPAHTYSTYSCVPALSPTLLSQFVCSHRGCNKANLTDLSMLVRGLRIFFSSRCAFSLWMLALHLALIF